jgi:asparagine synthetase B (glutamine-hydrolysing)
MTALFCIAARSAAGRAQLAQGLDALLPDTFPPAGPQWLAPANGGFALHAPEQVGTIGGRHAGSMLGFAGMLHEGARDDLLLQLCHRGSRALDGIAGSFAFVFWDAARRELLLARDQPGQGTLFVREDAGFYLICSELAPLLADRRHAVRLDFESAFHYLQFGRPLPGRTLARQVTCVPAAHVLHWNGAGPLLVQRYYTPIGFDEPKVIEYDAQRDRIAALLDEATAARIGPGRNAILLSGGVDSSFLAASAARLAGGTRFDAYTIAFAAPYAHNEGEYAALVAQANGIRHHNVPMSVADAKGALERVLAAAQPCSAWSCVTHYHLLDWIGADGHAQLLSGLGSDEVFGGYWKFFQAYARQRRHEVAWTAGEQVAATDALMWVPQTARAKLFAGVPRFFTEHACRNGLLEPWRGWNHVGLLVEFYRECRRYKHDAHLFELMVAHECQHRIPELLFAGFEAPARAGGIAMGYPFLAPAVMRAACALGAAERYWRSEGRWRNKKVLREIAASRVPPAIMARPLHSYTAPFALWLQDGAFGATVSACLHDSGLWDAGLLAPHWLATVQGEVAACLADPTPRRYNYLEQLWVLLTLAAWHSRWVERKS